MLKINTMKYINMSDICKHTQKSIYEYQFTEEVLPGEYIFFDTNDWKYENLRFNVEVLFGDKCNNKEFYRMKNDFELMKILRKDYGISEGIFIYMN